MIVSPLHTIYLSVPNDICLELQQIYNMISQKYENKYPTLNEWNPHIDILTQRVKIENSSDYLQSLEKLDKKYKIFSVELSHFELSSDNKYIFLKLTRKSEASIISLRNKIEEVVKKYADLTVTQYHLNKWNEYTKKEKELIEKTGSPHVYCPHISIIKLDPKDTARALKDINQKLINSLQWTATDLVVTRQSEDPENIFPIIKRMSLI
ncbi:2'-5' RNA ligase family protein [Candidatus Dojkabacteria bacterium]|nr:2'-5' RNA ligase family protein [Candidatus Dojkabacteria bacterium]